MLEWQKKLLDYFCDLWNEGDIDITLYLISGHTIEGKLEFSGSESGKPGRSPEDNNLSLTTEDREELLKSGVVDMVVDGKSFSTHVSMVVGYARPN